MLRSSLFLIAGLVGGWLIAASWPRAPVSTSPADPGHGLEIPGVAARIEALEAALAGERERRLELAAELEALEASVARLEPGRAGDGAAGVDRAADVVFAPQDSEEGALEERLWRLGEMRSGSRGDRRADRLIDAGFAPDRAEWITRREDELRMSALEAQYEARRTGEPIDAAALADVSATLRAELGDADYQRYLEATGRPTSVGVVDVMTGSPAETAGLEPGDRLVSYDGQRVYDVRDLNRLTVEGTPGEPVTMEVLRDDQTIQLVIRRGPLGISGGGPFRRIRGVPPPRGGR